MKASDGSVARKADLVRASDAERDVVIGELSHRFAEGRLTHDTFAARIDAAMRARLRGELDGLLADLPARRRFGAAVLGSVAFVTSRARRAVAAVDRWSRKPPTPLMLPAGPQLRFTIGREPSCDMTLADETVSRWHACLVRRDDAWLLDDLGSTNGTRVNGWRVNLPTPVSPGDHVSFGAATFVIRSHPGAASDWGNAA